jgi:hypothetical protein
LCASLKSRCRRRWPRLGLGSGPRKARKSIGKGSWRSEAFGVAEEVGGAEDLLLALAEPPYELRDYERLPESSEAFVYAAMSRLMVRRLARA